MLEVPIVVIVCGEGGSGGALGIAIGDRVLMQEFAVCRVIPPEGCAAILWRDANRRSTRRQPFKSTSSDLLELGLIDYMAPEPSGGGPTPITTPPPPSSIRYSDGRSPSWRR